MESKIFGVLGLSILVLMMFMSLGSAAINFSNIPTLTQDGDSFTIIVSTNETETIDFSATTIKDSGGDQIVFTPFSGVFFKADTPQDITINYTVNSDFDFDFEEVYFTTLTASGNVSADDTNQTLFFEKVFCEYENQGNLYIKVRKISVEEGFGNDEEYWYPLDEIKITLDVENKGNWDIDDIEIEVCLLDKEEGECIMDEDDMELSDDDFDFGDGDEDQITLTFKIDPDDLTKGNDKYTFYVKATGEIADSDAGEFDEKYTCVSDSEEIEIRTDEKFIVLDDFQYPETVQCGSEVQILADVWNIGDTKIDEDEIYVLIYDKELGINEVINIDDISALDYEPLEIIVNIPQNAEEKTYTLEFSVYDDEDMRDNDLYENSEKDEAIYSISLKVEGNCVSALPTVSVSADPDTAIQSGGKAGEELVLKVTVTNTGDSTTTYTLNAAGYTEWASAAGLSMTIPTLTAGQSADILVTFDVNKDADGIYLFNFEVLSENQLVLTQPINVEIEKSGWSITGWNIRENPYVWGIGLFNIILIIIIVIVAVRLARK